MCACVCTYMCACMCVCARMCMFSGILHTTIAEDATVSGAGDHMIILWHN